MKKVIVIGIIVLFISMSVLSSVSSKDVSVSNKRILEDNNEIPLWDEYNEIISHIVGEGQFHGEVLPLFLIFSNFTLDEGEFYISAITKNPSNRFYSATAYKINVALFIGILVPSNPPTSVTDYINGYALGNIEWELIE